MRGQLRQLWQLLELLVAETGPEGRQLGRGGGGGLQQGGVDTCTGDSQAMLDILANISTIYNCFYYLQ